MKKYVISGLLFLSVSIPIFSIIENTSHKLFLNKQLVELKTPIIKKGNHYFLPLRDLLKPLSSTL